MKKRFDQTTKNHVTKWLKTALAMTLTVGLLAGCSSNTPEDTTTIRVGSLKGPTSMGILNLMDETAKNTESTAEPEYTFQMATAADEILPLMVKGDLDVALVPANVAAVLYQRMEGNLSVIDINTLGVLYLVSGDTSIGNVTDLSGKTVYLTGKGTTPDYVLHYLMSANGLDESMVTLEYKSEATEVAAVLAEDPQAIGLLPQPFVTAACMQNEALSVIMDMNEEWTSIQGESGSRMVTGVTVVRKDFLEEHEAVVQRFLEKHKESTDAINADPAQGAALAVEAGIVAKEPIAQKAIPECNITCITGDEMKQALSGYLEVLFEQAPESVGGSLPGDDFYYTGQS